MQSIAEMKAAVFDLIRAREAHLNAASQLAEQINQKSAEINKLEAPPSDEE